MQEPTSPKTTATDDDDEAARLYQALQPPPHQLTYAEPMRRPMLYDMLDHVAVVVVRRLLFSLGCGLLAFGAISGWTSTNRSDAPYAAGWGAGLIALTCSTWRRRGM